MLAPLLDHVNDVNQQPCAVNHGGWPWRGVGGGVLKLLHPEQRCDFLSYGDETACKLLLRTMMSGILGSIQFVFIYTPTVETVTSQFTETQGPTAPPPPQARPPPQAAG